MDFRSLSRGAAAALATLAATACQGGGANPPSLATGQVFVATGALSAAPAAIAFSGTGAAFAQTVNLTSTVAVPNGAVTVDPGSCGTGASAIVTFGSPAGSGQSFTDLVAPVNAGTCTATFSSAGGGSAPVAFTVNAASVKLTGHGRGSPR